MTDVQAAPAAGAGAGAIVPPPIRARGTDPARDGLVGIYARRILDRGLDPRTLVAAHRLIRYGLTDRISQRWTVAEPVLTIIDVGRAAPAAARARPVTTALSPRSAAPLRPQRVRRVALPSLPGLASLAFGQQTVPGRNPRRLVTAGFAIAAVLGLGAVGAFAKEPPLPQRPAVVAGNSHAEAPTRYDLALGR